MNEFLIEYEQLEECIEGSALLWDDHEGLKAQLKAVEKDFDEDVLDFTADSDFVIHCDDVEEGTQKSIELIRKWADEEQSVPSMTAICSVAADRFSVKDEAYKKAIMYAGFLADVTHAFDYHNNMHFRKVCLQIMRMIAMHNHLHQNDNDKLNEREISLLLIGAAIHDLGHDGKSNMAQGIPYPGRLEQRSFDLACRVFHVIGFSNIEDWRALNVMLLSTDVSSSADHSSYCTQMKMSYAYHFQDGAVPLRLDEDINELKTNTRLALLACMLHEADIATSAGIDYEVSMGESCLLAKETGIEEIATPRGLLNFYTHICNNRMLTEAGVKLYEDNMRKNRRKAEAGVNEGNKIFSYKT